MHRECTNLCWRWLLPRSDTLSYLHRNDTNNRHAAEALTGYTDSRCVPRIRSADRPRPMIASTILIESSKQRAQRRWDWLSNIQAQVLCIRHCGHTLNMCQATDLVWLPQPWAELPQWRTLSELYRESCYSEPVWRQPGQSTCSIRYSRVSVWWFELRSD